IQEQAAEIESKRGAAIRRAKKAKISCDQHHVLRAGSIHFKVTYAAGGGGAQCEPYRRPPGLAAIRAFQDICAGGGVTVKLVAKAEIDGVWRAAERGRASGGGEEIVRQSCPAGLVTLKISRLPQPAGRGQKIKDVGVCRVGKDGAGASAVGDGAQDAVLN